MYYEINLYGNLFDKYFNCSVYIYSFFLLYRHVNYFQFYHNNEMNSICFLRLA